jgi:hypothetical protein
MGYGTVVQIFEGQGTFVSLTVGEDGSTIGSFGLIDGITGTTPNIGIIKEGVSAKTFLYDVQITLGLRIVIAGDSPITCNFYKV